MDAAEPLVQPPAGDERIPVVDAGEQREDRARRDQVVKVRHHVVGVVQDHVAGREAERQPGEAAQPEDGDAVRVSFGRGDDRG